MYGIKSEVCIQIVVIILMLSVSAYAQWTNSVSEDEMTGERSCFAQSPVTSATKEMSFPYTDTYAWLGIGYDGQSEWVYFGFSNEPNLTDDDTMDGYDRINTRIKWDNEVVNATFTQEWGSKFIHFTNDRAAITKIIQSNTVLLELSWYGEGQTYFRFSLQGSSDAIRKMRSSCNKN